MAEFILISLAFISGVMAFFGPCGISMLPAYVSYILGSKEDKNKGTKKTAIRGLLFGVITTLGIVSIYILMGVAFSISGAFLKPFVPLMGFITGMILVSVGVLVYFEKFPYVHFYHLKISKGLKRSRFFSFYLFGAGYGVAQLSCTLPIFLLVVFQALAIGSFIDGMFIFLIYGIGIGIGMIIASVGSALSREAIQKYIAIIVPHIRKLTALVLVLAGLYQIYFQIAVNNIFAFL